MGTPTLSPLSTALGHCRATLCYVSELADRNVTYYTSTLVSSSSSSSKLQSETLKIYPSLTNHVSDGVHQGEIPGGQDGLPQAVGSHARHRLAAKGKHLFNNHNKHFIHKINYKITLTLLESGGSSYTLISGK